MNVVSHHEGIVLDLLPLKALLVDVLLRDLTGENLAADEIATTEDQLHLIQDEVNLLNCLQGAIGLNLDLLDHLGGIVMLSISFQHLCMHTSYLSVFPFKEHFALTCLPESIEHFVSLFSGR